MYRMISRRASARVANFSISGRSVFSFPKNDSASSSSMPQLAAVDR
jgi:hypothetical protein